MTERGDGGRVGANSSQPIVIAGPTGSGKGALAFELASRLGGEVISVDSMKLYREIDIATAKPSGDARRGIPCHLLDVLDPNEEFSVSDYITRLHAVLADLGRRGVQPILCGGTALYLKAFLEGLQAGPAPDWELREQLLLEAAQSGPEVLHGRLATLDPPAAEKIKPTDTRRLIRALEVFTRTGRRFSAGWSWSLPEEPTPQARLFGLAWPRAELYRRIDLRVGRMVQRGLFEESRRLRGRKPPLSRSVAQAIGYKEILQGDAEGIGEAEVVENIRRSTRRFAKRQLTWFRKFPIEWLAAHEDSRPATLADEVLKRLEGPPVRARTLPQGQDPCGDRPGG